MKQNGESALAAYFNEIDPYAAAWLRNLIDAGHIAPGDVDERSIEMPAPRKDYTRAVELYKSGLSLADVAEQFSVTRQAMHKILTRRGVEMRQPNLQPVVEWRGRKFTRRENGYYAETTGNREYLHRAMWMEAHGPIPDGYEVHHRNGDKEINDLGNFELLSSVEHGKAHGFAGNQYVPSTGKRPVKCELSTTK